jgi:hypothetical protein
MAGPILERSHVLLKGRPAALLARSRAQLRSVRPLLPPLAPVAAFTDAACLSHFNSANHRVDGVF